MTQDTRTPDAEAIASELTALRKELAQLNSHRFITIHNSLWRLFLLRFATGLFTGLGTVIGATALVSFLLLLLAQIEWIPLIGDLASEIADRIDIEVTTDPNTASDEPE